MTDTLAWDAYAGQRPERRPVNGRGETTWFNWTQHADHGPGAELLALPDRGSVLDLGCGKGGNAAHLATVGHHTAGVDISPRQLDAARTRWGHLGRLTLHQANALDYLEEPGPDFDAVYSVYGAMWFTEPATLLAVIRSRLRPGGVLAFSQRPPVEGCYGCQASYIPHADDEDPFVVRRWDYEPTVWTHLLYESGFTKVAAQVLPPPLGKRRTGTLLVEARV
ncbi:bifunctional 2-polyprenyl-6-hydroxyphenol methylase/3-demethylubiquinol 3-O-methyltransferase UbiG [Streptomyces sp. TS71-3]|uniref:class I SAM-dependent methyltransferase n=1 Tax=Streptomyces sp. TS71-3 TaxID=2733862 RepID=UPI001B22D24D|nr:class I SAM-dependent methyltransferase [Streptomyces sp. TS71-3]GHJ36830.1 hypothetical protein Sm713_24390 [Streptomyces sp. TS71-3]